MNYGKMEVEVKIMKNVFWKRLGILFVLSLVLLCHFCFAATSITNLKKKATLSIDDEKATNNIVIKINDKIRKNGDSIFIQEEESLKIKISLEKNSLYGISEATLTLDEEPTKTLKRLDNGVEDEYILPKNLEDGKHALTITAKVSELYIRPVITPELSTIALGNSAMLALINTNMTSNSIPGVVEYQFILLKNVEAEQPELTISKPPVAFISSSVKISNIPIEKEPISITKIPASEISKTPIQKITPEKLAVPTRAITSVKENPTPVITKMVPPIKDITLVPVDSMIPEPTSAKKTPQPEDPIPVPSKIVPPYETEEIEDELDADKKYTVSDWAKDEVSKAEKDKLIPTSVGENLKKDVTRKEFAAIALRFYETYTGCKVEKPINNPFYDTADDEVLRAYAIGITNGTSENTFSPNQNITREQMATMMTRALDKAGIGTTVGAIGMGAKFYDHMNISDYAVQSVYFMAGNNIIKGVGDNIFDSKGNATIEQSVLISERMYQTF